MPEARSNLYRPVFSTNMAEIVKSFRHFMLVVYRPKVVYRPIHFGEDNTKSIPFSKAKCLKEISISFAGYSIKQHDTADCLGCQIDYKSNGEGMASKS